MQCRILKYLKGGNLQKTTITALIVTIALGLKIPLPANSKADPYCRQVNYPIGLNVRSAPTSSSRRMGSLAYGQKVKIVGKLKRVGTDNVIVIPTTAQDSDGTTWVKIKAPLRGFVLFTTGRDRDSLTSCENSSA